MLGFGQADAERRERDAVSERPPDEWVLPRLIVLTDSKGHPEPERRLSPLLERAAPGSITIVLRDREDPVRERLVRGQKLSALTQRTGQALVVSDRLDLALGLGACGVHLSTRGVSPLDARALFPSGRAWVSRAAHGWEQLTEGELDALTAVLVSPVCAPRKGRDALGIRGFVEKMAALRALQPRLGVYALGGVDASQAAQLLQAGATGVAVIGAAFSERVSDLLDALEIAA